MAASAPEERPWEFLPWADRKRREKAYFADMHEATEDDRSSSLCEMKATPRSDGDSFPALRDGSYNYHAMMSARTFNKKMELYDTHMRGHVAWTFAWTFDKKMKLYDAHMQEHVAAELARAADPLRRELQALREHVAAEVAKTTDSLKEEVEALREHVAAEVEKPMDSFKQEVEAMRVRLAQTERDVDLLWDMHRTPELLGDKTFLTSNFKRFYTRDLAITDPDKYWEKTREVLEEFYREQGVGDASASKAESFAASLRADVESNSGNASAALASTCAWLSTRAWTSTLTDPVFDREWCGILNQISREDKKRLVRASSAITATMAGFNVTDRTKSAPPIAWPEGNLPGEIAWTLGRGGRIPEDALVWFEQHIGEIGRIPMNLATSKNTNRSKDFMNLHSYPKTYPNTSTPMPKVMWYYIIDPDLRCDHVNCLESLTLAPGEQEFLFPPYSAFKVRSVERKDGFSVITLEVVPDNTQAREQAPVVPWG